VNLLRPPVLRHGALWLACLACPALALLTSCAARAPVAASRAGLPAPLELAFSEPLAAGLAVDIDLWLSPVLETPDGHAPVRIIHAVAAYNVNQLWITKCVVSGAFDVGSVDVLDLGTSGVDVGLARSMAAHILGVEEAHPYEREVTGSCTLLVRPRVGRTWGTVAGEADLDVTVRPGH